jgi:hypothetical protein
LLRIHDWSNKPRVLGGIYKIELAVSNSGIFGDHTKYLMPFTGPDMFWTPAPKDDGFVEAFLPIREERTRFLISLRHFHPGVHDKSVQHYRGKDFQSAARKYGELQQLVRTNMQLTPDDIAHLNAAQAEALPSSVYDTESYIRQVKALNEKVWAFHGKMRSSPMEATLAEYWCHEWCTIQTQIALVESRLQNRQARQRKCESPGPLVLSDFHPHNGFFDRDDECLLIFDFDCTSTLWSHEEALALAIHRFTREFVRRKPHGNTPRECRMAVESFLNAYAATGPHIDIENFKRELAGHIELVSFAKFCHISDRILDPRAGGKDLQGPRKLGLFAALRKHLMLLKEAAFYRFD